MTVDGHETSPVQDVAVIKVIADPPELAVSKGVNVFRNDPPFGSDTDLDVCENGKVHPTVWYRIVVRNIGGLPATNLTDPRFVGPLAERRLPATAVDTRPERHLRLLLRAHVHQRAGSISRTP